MDEYAWTEEHRLAWDRAESDLRAARKLLNVDDAALGFFHEYVEHNEQGLALDELAHAADPFDAPAKFWTLLRKAADEMQLTVADEIHGDAVQIIERHIS